MPCAVSQSAPASGSLPLLVAPFKTLCLRHSGEDRQTDKHRRPVVPLPLLRRRCCAPAARISRLCTAHGRAERRWRRGAGGRVGRQRRRAGVDGALRGPVGARVLAGGAGVARPHAGALGVGVDGAGQAVAGAGGGGHGVGAGRAGEAGGGTWGVGGGGEAGVDVGVEAAAAVRAARHTLRCVKYMQQAEAGE